MIKISERLMTVASLVSRDHVLADVGTDHGYVPIYLILQGKIKKAIAMDINRGPLERAREHISLYGMGDYIETRLSDGVEALALGEADSILIAGMGGGLVIRILEQGREVCHAAKELVLQPQSELPRVREFLFWEGYVTDAEEMVFEDGKYYPMMRVRYDAQIKKERCAQKQEPRTFLRELGFFYGEGLLEQRHPVLLQYLKKERSVYGEISASLKRQPDSEKIRDRRAVLAAEISRNERAIACYGDDYGREEHYFKD